MSTRSCLDAECGDREHLMNTRFTRVGVAVLALMVLSPWPSAAASFLLDFDSGLVSMFDGVPISQAYGDGPNHDVVYTSREGPGAALAYPTSPRFWDLDYGDLRFVTYCDECELAGVGEIAILPLPGYVVTLRSFDLGGYRYDPLVGPAEFNSQFTIYDAAHGVLFSSGAMTVAGGPGHLSFAPNLTSGTGVILQWGPDAYDVGLDNVAFDVSPSAPVPEPASLLLVATGLAAAGVKRWRAL